MRRRIYFAGLMMLAVLANPGAGAEPRGKPTEEQIARLLYPDMELASAGRRHFIYKAWAKFPGRSIVASYGKPEGKGGAVLRVEIAVLSSDGAGLTVISRNTFRYTIGFGVDKLQIDTANYQIAGAVTAFGLRAFSLYAGSGYEHHYESLDLFVLGSNAINHVAGNLAFGDNGSIESHNEYSYCNSASLCDPVWTRDIAKTIVIVTSNRTNGYFDLIAKTTKTEESGPLDASGPTATEKAPPETTTRLFRWDGEKYQDEQEK